MHLKILLITKTLRKDGWETDVTKSEITTTEKIYSIRITTCGKALPVRKDKAM
jgi:hypothetical protein